MATRRDNAGSAVLGGKLYVFGGGTRDAGGYTSLTLTSVEMYDPIATHGCRVRTCQPVVGRWRWGPSRAGRS